MGQRRSLVAGLKPDRATEDAFIRSGKATTSAPAQGGEQSLPTATVLPTAPAPAVLPQPHTRQRGTRVSGAPLSTRIRPDFFAALKRASLERQLNGTVPNTIQAILEEALEPWLRQHNYLP